MKRALIGLALFIGLAGEVTAQGILPSNQNTLKGTNYSDTIAVSNTFQTLWTASPNRHGCTIQNTSADSQWVYPDVAANATKAGAILLAAGQSLNCSQGLWSLSNAWSITGTATDTFYAESW